jgi:hypothetical protein
VPLVLSAEEVAAARLRSDPVAYAVWLVESEPEERFTRQGLVKAVWMTGSHLSRAQAGLAVKYLLEEGVLATRLTARRGRKVRIVRGERWDDEQAISRARARTREHLTSHASGRRWRPEWEKPEKPKGRVRAFRA